MFNIVKMQDLLKNLPDDKLAQLAQDPSGMVPPYLVVSEKQRRDKMREEFSGAQAPKNTVAQEMFGDVPPDGQNAPQQPPQGGPPPEGQDANAQGLMGLPDQTMAGNAMRAMISGQPQQVDGMTAMPPQGMAAGGAVSTAPVFSSLFSNGAPQAQDKYAGYAPVQQYSPTPYTPPKDDYSDIRHQFDGRPPPHDPNPRVHMSVADRYGLPAGMAAPTYGTPGLNRTYTGRDGGHAHYSWANDAARDAYIRYMTPPAKTATAAPAAGATAPVTKADGGPIRMGSGMGVDGGEDRFTQGLGGMSSNELIDEYENSSLRARRDAAKAEIDRRNSQTTLGKAWEAIGGNNLGAFLPPSPFPAMRDFSQNVGPALLGPANPQIALKLTPDEMARLAQRNRGGPAKPVAPEGAQTDNPPNVVPTGPVAPPARKATPASAPVSGASDKGIASLPQGPKGMTYEDYLKQANELIGSGRQDPEEARRNSMNMALMQLGLGMAASKNASPLAAIAEGGIPALQGYTEAEAQRRKDDRALAGEKLAALGVGAQMSQAEAKALADQKYREWEMGPKFEAEQRLQQAQINASMRNKDLETYAAFDPTGRGDPIAGAKVFMKMKSADPTDIIAFAKSVMADPLATKETKDIWTQIAMNVAKGDGVAQGPQITRVDANGHPVQ